MLQPKDDIRGQLLDLQKKLFGKSQDRNEHRNDPARRRRPNMALGASTKPNTVLAPPLGPEAKGQDMEFVVGLSENLLGECRRLTAENQKLKAKVKAALDEAQAQKTEITVLKSRGSVVDTEHAKLQDANWELESTVALLRDEVETLARTNEKLVQANNENVLKLGAVQRDHDEAVVALAGLETELLQTRENLTLEVRELRERVADLNDENDALLLKTAHEPPAAALEPLEELFNETVIKETEDFQRTIVQPTATVEAETLRVQLEQLARVIARLKTALAKAKRPKTPKREKKEKTPLLNRSSMIASPTKRFSKFIIVDEEWPQEGNWDFEQQTPTRRPVDDTDSVSDASIRERDLSNDEIQEYAKRHNLVVITADAYAELQSNNIECVSANQLTVAAKSRGFVCVSSEDYLLMQEEAHMRAKLLENGIVTLPEPEAAALKKKAQLYDQPSMEYLAERLELEGLTYIEKDHLVKLRETEASFHNPPLDLLQAKCKEQGLHVLTKEAHDKLKAAEVELDRPSKAFLTEKANAMGLVVTAGSTYSDLVKRANPDKAALAAISAALGMAAVSKDTYEKLANPTVEDLRKGAETHGCVVVPKEHLLPSLDKVLELAQKHDCLLVSRKEYESPSLDYVSGAAEKLNHVVTPASDYTKLKAQAESPSLAHVQAHAEKHNLVTLAKEEYTQLYKSANDPSAEELAEKAANKLLRIVKETEYEQLVSPPVEFLKEKAAPHGFVVVDKKVMKALEEPSFEDVEKHADRLKCVLLRNEHYNSLEFLKTRAKAQSHVVVSSEELENLKAPSLQMVREHAEMFEHTLILKNVFDEVKRRATKPTKEELEKHAKGLGLDVFNPLEAAAISLSELTKLRKPTVDQLREQAKAIGQDIISIAEKEALVDPSLDAIKKGGAKHEHVVIPEIEYKNLKTPTLNDLKMHSEIHGHVVVNETRYKELENPSLDSLKTYAESTGHLVVPTSTHNELAEIVEKPSLHFLMEKAATHNHIVVPSEDWKLLNEPPKERVEQLAKRYNSVLVSGEKMRLFLEPLVESIIESAKKHNHVLLEAESFEQLKKNAEEPSIEHIKAKLPSALVILPNSEVTSMKKQLENPKIEYLAEHANNMGHKLLQQSEYDKLSSLANLPPLDHIERCAKEHKHALILEDELVSLNDELKEANDTRKSFETQLNMPSKEYLAEHAEKHNHVFIERLQFDDKISSFESDIKEKDIQIRRQEAAHAEKLAQLRRAAEEPTQEELEQHAAARDAKIVPISAYTQLKELAETPDLAHIKSKAETHAHVVLPKSRFEKLLRERESVDFISQKASSLGYVTISKDEHGLLVNPPKEQIEKIANERDMVAVDRSEYRTLKKNAEKPSSAHLLAKVAAVGLTAIPTVEFLAMQKKANEPTIDELKSRASTYHLSLVDDRELKELKQLANDPPVSHLEKTCSRMDLVVVPKAELSLLQSMAHEPSLEHLTAAADKRDHALVAKPRLAEMEAQLHEPSVSQLEKWAAKRDHVILPNKATDDLLIGVISRMAKEANLLVIPTLELADLRDTVDLPPTDFLRDKAKSKGLELILSEELATLTSTVELPSKKHVEERAEHLGFKLVGVEQFDAWKTHEKKSNEQIVTELGYHPITQADFETLEKKLSCPEKEYLVEKAAATNHVVIDKTEFDALKSKVEEPSVAFLESKAQDAGYEIVERSKYLLLTKPLEAQIEEAGMVPVTHDAFKDMKRRAEEPTEEEIKVFGEEMGLVTIKVELHNQLSKLALETLDDKLRAKGMVGLPREEHSALLRQVSSMTEQVNQPTLEYVREHAQKQAHVLVPEEEHRDLVKSSKMSVHDLAAGLGLVAIEAAQLATLKALHEETIEAKASKKGLKVILPLEHEALLNPPMETIREHARRAGFAVVDEKELLETRAKASQPIEEKAREIDSVVVARVEYEKLSAVSTNPSESFIRAKGELIGLAVLDKSAYEAMLQSLEAPKADFLKEKAEKSGHKLLEEADYEKMVLDLNSLRIELESQRASYASSQEQLLACDTELEAKKREVSGMEEMMKASEEAFQSTKRDLDSLKAELDASKDLVENPSRSYLESKSQTHGLHTVSDDNCAEFIRNHAEPHGLVVLPSDDRRLDPDAAFVKEHAERLGLIAISAHDHAALLAPTLDTIQKEAKNNGHVLVSEDEYKGLSEPAIEDVRALAEAKSHVVVPREEYETPNRAFLEEKAKSHGLSLVGDPMEYIKTTAPTLALAVLPIAELDAIQKQKEGMASIPEEELQRLQKPSLDSLRKHADSHDHSIVPLAQLKHLNQQASKTLEERVEEEPGYRLLPAEKYDELLLQANKPLMEHMSAMAAKMGLLLVSETEYESLKQLHSEPLEARAAAAQMAVLPASELEALRAPTLETIKKHAVALGAVTFLASDIEEAREVLAKAGYDVVPQFSDAKETFDLSRDELETSASKLGLNVVSPDEAPSRESLEESAGKLGLVVSEPPSKDSLESAASQLSLSVVATAELLQLKLSLAEKDTLLNEMKNEAATRDALMERLRELDLVILDKGEYQQLKSADGVLTGAELETRALQMGFTLVKNSDFQEMKRRSAAARNEQSVRALAKQFGLVCVAATSVVGESERMTALPTAEYNLLKRRTLENVSEEVFRAHAEKKGYRRPSVHDVSHSPSPNENDDQGASMLDSITEMSIATNISFTDRGMIPAITQVVIGEYVFKYFRRMGLSSISADRHERYFWVHPYSLTLYWLTSNPSLANPNDLRTKAVAIRKVEVVDDNNPLPVGLYYKSIVVSSPTKTVKFTCQTRQRHNIWYNALRYLVHRSQEGAEPEDFADITVDPSTRNALPRGPLPRSKLWVRR